MIIIHTRLKGTDYVWYASYGSNLDRNRFSCYIEGGKPEGSGKVEAGCRDQSPPIKEATHIMRYPLYFAKESARWQQQGVAFIGLDKDEKHYTYSTKYLITVEQFMDVVKQENNGLNLEIDLETVMVNGLEAFSNSWYGMILHIGEAEGYPIFTFTADSEPEITFNKPSDEYLSMIINGLKTTIGLENTEITNYLTSKPGITGNCDRKAIEKLVLNWGDRSIQI